MPSVPPAQTARCQELGFLPSGPDYVPLLEPAPSNSHGKTIDPAGATWQRRRRTVLLLIAIATVLVAEVALVATLAALRSARVHSATSSTSLDQLVGNPPLITTDRRQRLVVFGDSYSDVGNDHRLDPSNPITFSNNQPVWNQYLADSINRTLLTFAYGGATTNSTRLRGLAVPSVNDQLYHVLPTFLEPHTPAQILGHAPIFALYSGVNDYVPQWARAVDLQPQEVVGYMRGYIEHLLEVYNATRVVLPTLPPVEYMPGVAGLPESEWAHLRDLRVWHDGNLTAMAAEVVRAHAGVRVQVVDVGATLEGIIDAVVKEGSYFGIEDVTGQCALKCKGVEDGNRFLWWDVWHLTTRGHELMAGTMLRALAEAGFI
ncbi:hypothetical protein HK101_000627 [Irineochytrium annulatum]|nr:hypothetical protein HK101_000627 [Irineochytrium annulatum]